VNLDVSGADEDEDDDHEAEEAEDEEACAESADSR
jgi:hypothetical protein